MSARDRRELSWPRARTASRTRAAPRRPRGRARGRTDVICPDIRLSGAPSGKQGEARAPRRGVVPTRESLKDSERKNLERLLARSSVARSHFYTCTGGAGRESKAPDDGDRINIKMEALAAACTQPQRSIARKYLANALSSPQRRSIRCANKTFAALTSEAPAALELLQAAGFVHECTDGEGYYTLRPDTANGAGEVDQQIHAAIAALNRCISPSLLALPDELLLRILHRLPADDLSALQRVSRASGSHASASPWG